jgi:hypothetical protein
MRYYMTARGRAALLKTIQLLSERPQVYDFYECQVPRKRKGPCPDSGCLLGWVGHFMRAPRLGWLNKIAQQLGFEESSAFYEWMERRVGGPGRAIEIRYEWSPLWTKDAATAVKHLRVLARRKVRE